MIEHPTLIEARRFRDGGVQRIECLVDLHDGEPPCWIDALAYVWWTDDRPLVEYRRAQILARTNIFVGS